MGNRRNWVIRGVNGVLESVRREKEGKLIHRFIRGRVLEDNAEGALTLNHPPTKAGLYRRSSFSC